MSNSLSRDEAFIFVVLMRGQNLFFDFKVDLHHFYLVHFCSATAAQEIFSKRIIRCHVLKLYVMR